MREDPGPEIPSKTKSTLLLGRKLLVCFSLALPPFFFLNKTSENKITINTDNTVKSTPPFQTITFAKPFWTPTSLYNDTLHGWFVSNLEYKLSKKPINPNYILKSDSSPE